MSSEIRDVIIPRPIPILRARSAREIGSFSRTRLRIIRRLMSREVERVARTNRFVSMRRSVTASGLRRGIPARRLRGSGGHYYSSSPPWIHDVVTASEELICSYYEQIARFQERSQELLSPTDRGSSSSITTVSSIPTLPYEGPRARYTRKRARCP